MILRRIVNVAGLHRVGVWLVEMKLLLKIWAVVLNLLNHQGMICPVVEKHSRLLMVVALKMGHRKMPDVVVVVVGISLMSH